MRKYSSSLECLRNEMYEVMKKSLIEQVGSLLDKEHEIRLNENVYDLGFNECEYKANCLHLDYFDNFVLYDDEFEIGSLFNFSTDVIADVCDIILDGRFEYCKIDEDDIE